MCRPTVYTRNLDLKGKACSCCAEFPQRRDRRKHSLRRRGCKSAPASMPQRIRVTLTPDSVQCSPTTTPLLRSTLHKFIQDVLEHTQRVGDTTVTPAVMTPFTGVANPRCTLRTQRPKFLIPTHIRIGLFYIAPAQHSRYIIAGYVLHGYLSLIWTSGIHCKG